MASERAAKRARSEGNASDAAGTSAAAGPSGGGRAAGNAFDVLPDDLVQRIMSFVEVRDAWEVSRLQQVDRRFRRLVRGVEWDDLVLQDSGEGTELERMKRYRQTLERMTERVQRKDVLGVRRVVVGGLQLGQRRPACAALRMRSVPQTDEGMTALFAVTRAIGGLFAVLAVASTPLEHVAWSDITGLWFRWPSDREQRAAWPDDHDELSRSQEEVAASHLFALSPAATLRSLQLSCESARFAAACRSLPPDALPSGISDIRLECGVNEPVMRAMVQAWPGLRRVRVSVLNVEALRDLAALKSLESLNVDCVYAPTDEEGDELAEALEAIAGAAGAATRLRELAIGWYCPMSSNRGVAAVLSLHALEFLWIGVGRDSAALLGGLASLERLSSLRLGLDINSDKQLVVRGGDRGAALFGAAAAALERCRALENLYLRINDAQPPEEEEPLPPLDDGGVVALLRAARPKLVKLYFTTGPTSREVVRELAACGPKLEHVEFTTRPFSTAAPSLLPLREFLSLSPDRLPRFKLQLTVRRGLRLDQEYGAILKGWFHVLPCIVLICC